MCVPPRSSSLAPAKTTLPGKFGNFGSRDTNWGGCRHAHPSSRRSWRSGQRKTGRVEVGKTKAMHGTSDLKRLCLRRELAQAKLDSIRCGLPSPTLCLFWLIPAAHSELNGGPHRSWRTRSTSKLFFGKSVEERAYHGMDGGRRRA